MVLSRAARGRRRRQSRTPHPRGERQQSHETPSLKLVTFTSSSYIQCEIGNSDSIVPSVSYVKFAAKLGRPSKYPPTVSHDAWRQLPLQRGGGAAARRPHTNVHRRRNPRRQVRTPRTARCEANESRTPSLPIWSEVPRTTLAEIRAVKSARQLLLAVYLEGVKPYTHPTPYTLHATRHTPHATRHSPQPTAHTLHAGA